MADSAFVQLLTVDWEGYNSPLYESMLSYPHAKLVKSHACLTADDEQRIAEWESRYV